MIVEIINLDRISQHLQTHPALIKEAVQKFFNEDPGLNNIYEDEDGTAEFCVLLPVCDCPNHLIYVDFDLLSIDPFIRVAANQDTFYFNYLKGEKKNA